MGTYGQSILMSLPEIDILVLTPLQSLPVDIFMPDFPGYNIVIPVTVDISYGVRGNPGRENGAGIGEGDGDIVDGVDGAAEGGRLSGIQDRVLL